MQLNYFNILFYFHVVFIAAFFSLVDILLQ